MSHYVDVVTLSRSAASHRWQANWMIALGVACGLFASFWIAVGVGMILDPRHQDDWRTGLGCAVCSAVVLGIPALTGIAWGIARRRKVARFVRFAWVAEQNKALDHRTLADALKVDRETVDAWLVEAWSLGVLRRAVVPVAFDATLPAHATPPAPKSEGGSLVGRTLAGTWRVVRHLGDGGSGSVYEAVHVRIPRRTAVKVLHPDLRLSPDAIKRFEREAVTASGLGHPGIVDVYDFGVAEDGLHFLVMELLEGETLEQRLANDGAIPWRTALELGAQIASALAAAHAVDVLHRDLKPANIFLARAKNGGNRVVLLDFGLAKALDASASHTKLTAHGAAVGTPAYMSPEQARGLALDARSDVWALGIVLHEMLTGAPPYLDATVAGLFAKLLTEPTPHLVLPGCPRAFASVVERALAKDPAERFADAAAMHTALEACAQGDWPPIATA